MTGESLRRSQSEVRRWWYASRWCVYVDAVLFTGALWPGSPPAVSGWLITSGLLILCAAASWGVVVVRCPSCRTSLLSLAVKQESLGLSQWLALHTSCGVCARDRDTQHPLDNRHVGGGLLPSTASGSASVADGVVARNGELRAGTLAAAGVGLLLALGAAGVITFVLIQLSWLGEEPAARSPLAAGLSIGAWIPGAVLGAFAATRLSRRRSGSAALVLAGMLLLTVGLLTVSQAIARPVWLYVVWAASVVGAACVGHVIGHPRAKTDRIGE
jgi:hypothetical protein